MAEYISKEFMLKNLEADKEKNAEHCEPVTVQIMERFIRYVKEFPAADVQPVDRWISVKDRLPKIGQSVLIYYPKWTGDEIQVANLEADGIMFDICGEFNIGIETVTHWQPLPEPPKDGDT